MLSPSSHVRIRCACAGALLLFAGGCGKPPPGQQGPPGDFAPQAVVARVGVEDIREAVRLVGSLSAQEAVEIAAETEGRIMEILFQEGSHVERGTVLVRLDPEMSAARLQESEARHSLAESDFRRARDLLESETISQQEFDRLQAAYLQAQASRSLARKSLQDTEIGAPFDGVMGERRVSVGAFVSRGMPLTTLVRLDPLEAEFNVPERYFAQLEGGQTMSISTVARPGEAFSGEVTFIAPVVDLSSRTVLVKASVPNADYRLRPGMFGQVNLVVQSRANATVIPETAVLRSVGGTSVVVVDDEDRAEFRSVSLGLRLPGRVEITEGLVAGERVVVEGHQKIGPGMKITVAADAPRPGEESTASAAVSE